MWPHTRTTCASTASRCRRAGRYGDTRSQDARPVNQTWWSPARKRTSPVATDIVFNRESKGISAGVADHPGAPPAPELASAREAGGDYICDVGDISAGAREHSEAAPEAEHGQPAIEDDTSKLSSPFNSFLHEEFWCDIGFPKERRWWEDTEEPNTLADTMIGLLGDMRSLLNKANGEAILDPVGRKSYEIGLASSSTPNVGTVNTNALSNVSISSRKESIENQNKMKKERGGATDVKFVLGAVICLGSVNIRSLSRHPCRA
jgi:hypothetical protein